VTARKYSETITWNFYHKLYGKTLAAAELYILRIYIYRALLYIVRIEIAVNKATENFAVFNKTNVSFQEGTTLKLDMRQVPVLQIYNKL